jgi:flagellar protein FlaG
MNPVQPANPTTVTASVAAAVPVSNDAQRAVTQEVLGAVKRLNEAGYAGEGKEITFSIDRTTRLPVVKVVDTNTKEVLQQWPAEYVLQLAADYTRSQRDSR